MSQRFPATSRSLPHALLRARERVLGPIRTLLLDAGLTEQQWRVLRVVEESGPLEPTRISELTCLLLPSLTRIFRTLEDKGLIGRTRHPDDRRKQVIAITDTGAAVIAMHLDSALEILERVRSQMGSERYEELVDLLIELDSTNPG